MIILALLLKPLAWLIAFRSGTRGTLKAMLLRAGGITLFLTLADKASVAANLPLPAILLTLTLYGVMSFTLLPLAWKVRNKALSTVLNLAGLLGAFAGVNFIMDFLRGILPFMNR